jgi:hypothetical protein
MDDSITTSQLIPRNCLIREVSSNYFDASRQIAEKPAGIASYDDYGPALQQQVP